MVGNAPGFSSKNVRWRWLNTGELSYLGYVYYLSVSEFTVIFSQDPNITKIKRKLNVLYFLLHTVRYIEQI
jgi:hypothetical protein